MQIASLIRMYIVKAREYGLKVYVGTLLPIYGWRTYEKFRDDLRNEFNSWIRNTDEIDGCIDFDKAVRAVEHPEAFAEGFDSGDHLHPSEQYLVTGSNNLQSCYCNPQQRMDSYPPHKIINDSC